MPDNKYLKKAIDLATQAKFPYVQILDIASNRTLEEVHEYFGMIFVQTTAGVTVELPLAGLDTLTRNYFRHCVNKEESTESINVRLFGGLEKTLQPGEGMFLYWTGTNWRTFNSVGTTQLSIQGRIEDPIIKPYLIRNGGRHTGYMHRLYLNVDSGSGIVRMLLDGVDITGDLSVVAGIETLHIFTNITVGYASTIDLEVTGAASLEGVHYRLDLNVRAF